LTLQMPCLARRAGRTNWHLTENTVFYPQHRRMEAAPPLRAAAAGAPLLSNLFFPRPEFAQDSPFVAVFFDARREQ
jgi:hypothetical protein